VYDGRWAGATAATPHGSAVVLSFEVIFGQVRNFRASWSGNTPCGPLSDSAAGTEATIASSGFQLTVTAPFPGTITATFSSPTQLSGSHTNFTFGVTATCPMQGGGFQNVGATALAGTLSAVKAP
jgi:hypothetical protein